MNPTICHDQAASISRFFAEEHIECYASLPIEECPVDGEKAKRVRLSFAPRSALVILLPYFVEQGENLSAYATSEDYHLYSTQLGERLCALLASLFPLESFRFFCDKSPIDERRAAARAGLGVFGDNGLLISQKYGSFVFLAEVLSTLTAEQFGCATAEDIKGCLHCGACKSACPTGCLTDWSRPCLSALTQKKGSFTEEEKAIFLQNETVWGCDTCQIVCPMNRKNGKIPQTPIPFFHNNRVSRITPELLLTLDDEAFSRRAFSWRGKDPLWRNLTLFSDKERIK